MQKFIVTILRPDYDEISRTAYDWEMTSQELVAYIKALPFKKGSEILDIKHIIERK
jgi:hypothetical protein